MFYPNIILAIQKMFFYPTYIFVYDKLFFILFVSTSTRIIQTVFDLNNKNIFSATFSNCKKPTPLFIIKITLIHLKNVQSI